MKKGTMNDDVWHCPHGHGELVRNDANGVHHTCDACHGFAVTIWLLDELLADGAGAGIWRSGAEAEANADPCPVCGRSMRPVPAPAPGTNEGRLEVCRVCEVVWIDAVAIPLLPVHPGVAAVGGASADPTHCPVCGAPYADYLSDRCRYCRARFAHLSSDTADAPDAADRLASAHAATRWPKDIVHEYIEGQGRAPR